MSEGIVDFEGLCGLEIFNKSKIPFQLHREINYCRAFNL